MRSVGAVFYILGFLIAGVMFVVIGAEYNKDDTDNDKLSAFFWFYAVSLFFAAIGEILENGDRFCGGEELKEVDYFGGLFQLVAVFAWAGFGLGLAHFYEDEQYWEDEAIGVIDQESADERSTLAWLSGVTAIVFAVGALLMLKDLLCCDGFSCSISTAQAFANMFICILLVILWFLYADRLNKGLYEEDDDDNKRRDYAYIIGVIYIIFSLVGILSFLSICNFGSGGKKPYKPRPGYGQRPSYDRPSYDKPDYGKPEYGKPEYGKPEYGKPEPGYGPAKPGYGPPPARY